MACACAQKSKQKFAVYSADGKTLIATFDQYSQAQTKSRETGGKIRVVKAA